MKGLQLVAALFCVVVVLLSTIEYAHCQDTTTGITATTANTATAASATTMPVTAAVRPTKAVIVAAGLGKRLRPYTDQMPKSMVPIAGKPMLLRTLECFRKVGVTEFVIVRGYLGHVFEQRKAELGEGVRFVDNLDYEQNNILLSLFKAEKELVGDVYFSYSDIIFSQDAMDKLAAAEGDITLIVDKQYAKIYEGRTEHPLQQAELCTLDGAGAINKIGKCCCEFKDGVGEFIGLGKFSAKGVKQLVDTFNEVRPQYEGTKDKPFIRAARWDQTYVCDLLEYMTLHKGIKMLPVFIEGRWREIDTVQDKEKADQTVDW